MVQEWFRGLIIVSKSPPPRFRYFWTDFSRWFAWFHQMSCQSLDIVRYIHYSWFCLVCWLVWKKKCFFLYECVLYAFLVWLAGNRQGDGGIDHPDEVGGNNWAVSLRWNQMFCTICQWQELIPPSIASWVYLFYIVLFIEIFTNPLCEVSDSLIGKHFSTCNEFRLWLEIKTNNLLQQCVVDFVMCANRLLLVFGI